MSLLDILTALGLSPAQALLIIPAISGVASVAAALLPHPPPGSQWVLARRLLDVVAGNLRNAANAVPPR